MDAITLAAIRRELSETLCAGRVQAIVQPSPTSLALEIYTQQRHWLLLDADPQAARVHLLAEKARRGLQTETPILLQARKRLRGARLIAVRQPSWERLLTFHFSHPQQGESTLVAEIMGRWSNLILLDARYEISGSLRHFQHNERAQRIMLPGHRYQPPPAQQNKTPLPQVQPDDCKRWLHQTPAGKPVWRTLVANIAGMSPLLARELLFRATGDALADVAHPNLSASGLMAVLDWACSLPQQGGWAPSVALDESDFPRAFAPYALTHLHALEHYRSISKAAQVFYNATLGRDSYNGQRQQILALITQARKKLQGRRVSLGQQAVGEQDLAHLRTQGEWLLAYAWQVQPGDRELVVDTGEGELTIPLDPTLSASENAQAIFARYHKMKRAAEKIPPLLAQVDQDLAWLEQLQSDAQLADNTPQLEELRTALLASGLVTESGPKRAKVARSQPLKLHTDQGFEVIIGRNALQNERVTWQMAQPDDIWLHAQDTPGAHAIIRAQGQDVPEADIAQAAAWTAWQSQARHNTKAAVIVTRRRHLRKIKGGRPGQVRVLQHRSITVRPQPPQT